MAFAGIFNRATAFTGRLSEIQQHLAWPANPPADHNGLSLFHMLSPVIVSTLAVNSVVAFHLDGQPTFDHFSSNAIALFVIRGLSEVLPATIPPTTSVTFCKIGVLTVPPNTEQQISSANTTFGSDRTITTASVPSDSRILLGSATLTGSDEVKNFLRAVNNPMPAPPPVQQLQQQPPQAIDMGSLMFEAISGNPGNYEYMEALKQCQGMQSSVDHYLRYFPTLPPGGQPSLGHFSFVAVSLAVTRFIDHLGDYRHENQIVLSKTAAQQILILRPNDTDASCANFRPTRDLPVTNLDGVVPTVTNFAGLIQLGFGEPLAQAIVNFAIALVKLARAPGSKLAEHPQELFKIINERVRRSPLDPDLSPLNPFAVRHDLPNRLAAYFAAHEHSPDVQDAIRRITAKDNAVLEERLKVMESAVKHSPPQSASGSSRRKKSVRSSYNPTARTSTRSQTKSTSSQSVPATSVSTLSKLQWNAARPSFLAFDDVPCYNWALGKGSCANQSECQSTRSKRPHKWPRRYNAAQMQTIKDWLAQHPISTGMQWASGDPGGGDA